MQRLAAPHFTAIIKMMTVPALLALYLCFRLKQFACDFLLQSQWMALGKGEPGLMGWKPLCAHAAIHGAGTLAVALIFAPALWWLGPLDFIIHGAVDRGTGWLKYKRGWTPATSWFWWLTGFDQEVHNLTHLAYIALIVGRMGGLH